MVETKTTQPQAGAWDKLSTEQVERHPKVMFDINIPQTVTFTVDAPREYVGESGAYYVFDVIQNKENKVIMTSAWSLLRAIKAIAPLKGKTITITKKLVKGKQTFEVSNVTA